MLAQTLRVILPTAEVALVPGRSDSDVDLVPGLTP